MDNQAYLNQLSQNTRPSAPQKSGLLGIFTPKLIKIIAGALIAFILLIICGSLLGGLNNKPLELTKQLSVRVDNLSTVIGNYGRTLKSPSVISAHTSLSGALLNTSTQLSSYLSETQNYDTKKPAEQLAASEQSVSDKLNETLEDARLNGILDRTYASQVRTAVGDILTIESEILARSKDEQLKTIVQDSYDSLTNLHNTLGKLLSQ